MYEGQMYDVRRIYEGNKVRRSRKSYIKINRTSIVHGTSYIVLQGKIAPQKAIFLFCQKSAKIDTISVENIRTGICLSNISLCVPSIRICHAQIGTIHPTQ